MSKIKPNNYESAIKQAEAFEKATGVKAETLTSRIRKLINKKDGINHYHVLLVKKRHDITNERYVVSGTAQTFGKGAAFSKMEKNYKNQGFASMIVFHNPTENAPKETIDLKQHEKSAIQSKIEKEEKDAMNERIKKRTEEAEANELKKKQAAEQAQKTSGQGAQNKSTGGKLVFEGVEVTADSVDKFAVDNKVDLKDVKTPEGKLAIVKKFIDDKTKK